MFALARLLFAAFSAIAGFAESGLIEDFLFYPVDAAGYTQSGKQYPATPLGAGTDCEMLAEDGHTCLKQWRETKPNVTCRGWAMRNAVYCPEHDDADTPTHTWKGMMPMGAYFAGCYYADKNKKYCMGDPAYATGGHVQTITGLTMNQCQWYVDQQNALGHFGPGAGILPQCS